MNKKKLAVLIIFVLCCQALEATTPYLVTTNKSEGSVSFVVDENLSAPEEHLYHSTGISLFRSLLNRCDVSEKDMNIIEFINEKFGSKYL